MTIFNLGSINADYFYRVPHLPGPGETIAATDRKTGLGGKGANQSVAIARAGGTVVHVGAVGPDGQWAVDRMADYGVDTRHIAQVATPTAHAIINVDPSGENAIVIFPGANASQDTARIAAALDESAAGDFLVLQNETSHQVEAAQMAHARGMTVVYSAAPFDAEAVIAVLPFVTLLIVNTVEAQQLASALSLSITDLPVPQLLITKGASGAVFFDLQKGETVSMRAFSVVPVDTTGAGDTFAGYTVAGFASGLTAEDSLRRAAAASALKVTKEGTADAIPSHEEVDAFLAARQ